MTPLPSPSPGFVHVDLDGLWTLAVCYGFDEADTFERDPVFGLAVARLLDVFAQCNLRATFFIVGRDLEHPDKARALADVAAAGHELANHSWSHRLDLETMASDELDDEIERTSAALERLTGVRPVGFRAPGYGAGPRVLAACARAGIRYDGSRLPTPWGPPLRWMAGRLRRRVRREIGASAAAPQAPRQYAGGGASTMPTLFTPPDGGPPIVRWPLAVSPHLRLPLQAGLGLMLGAGRVRSALRRLARRGRPVTWLIHGIDALAPEEMADRLPRALSTLRPFQTPLDTKLGFIREVLEELNRTTALRLTRDENPPQR